MTKLSKASDAVRWGRADYELGEEVDLHVIADVLFIAENGAGPGVRLRKGDKGEGT